MHTAVIAEIGSAWRFGDWHLENAYRAIDIAKDCGADIVKFQYCSDPRTMEQRRNVQEGSYEILAWPKEWIGLIHGYAESVGIEFMCTVFLPGDVAIMNPYVKRWKVASLEHADVSLLSAMVKTGKPVFVSCGAEKYESPFREVQSLHCTAAYPAPLSELNLLAISNYEYDGYSDHSCNIMTGALAVACGAAVVEVHFSLWDTPEDNPDYGHSLSPVKFRKYIGNIRQAELMLGDGIKKIQPSEEWALKHKVKA